MKKIFAIVALAATMVLASSCGQRASKAAEDATEAVDSTEVVVDSAAVAAAPADSVVTAE